MSPELCVREKDVLISFFGLSLQPIFAEMAFYGGQKMQNWSPMAAISEDSFLVFGVKMR